jgi:V/A-type H+-transporting ATPase subunit K
VPSDRQGTLNRRKGLLTNRFGNLYELRGVTYACSDTSNFRKDFNNMIASIAPVVNAVLQEGTTAAAPAIPPSAAAALAVGLAALGSGYAERGIGAAAVGAVAEDDSMFGRGLILTVLPETLVILALVVVFVV